MSAPKLKYGIGNGSSTTLSSSMTGADTATPLTASTAFQAAPTAGEGMVLLDESVATEEIAYSTGIVGASLTTPVANRGLEGGSAQGHSSGASVKGILTVGMWNDLITSLLNVLVQSSGALDTTKVVDLTTAQTLTNKTLTSPKIETGINDTNGNELIKVTPVASAVNEITISNNATGANPILSATGGDTNINLKLQGKGTGGVEAVIGAESTADHTATGIKVNLTAGSDVNFGDVCYIASTGKAVLVDADAIASSSGLVMALGTIATDAAGEFLLLGIARDDSWNWTVGGLIYITVTATTGNTLSQTAPTGTDDVIQIVGVATHADRMFFNPQLVQVEHT